jgi:hypothetical protein
MESRSYLLEQIKLAKAEGRRARNHDIPGFLVRFVVAIPNPRIRERAAVDYQKTNNLSELQPGS